MIYPALSADLLRLIPIWGIHSVGEVLLFNPGTGVVMWILITFARVRLPSCRATAALAVLSRKCAGTGPGPTVSMCSKAWNSAPAVLLLGAVAQYRQACERK